MRITHARALPNFRLELQFDNDESGVVDLSPRPGKGVPAAWYIPGVFELVSVTTDGAVEWPGEFDLCPDALYLQMTGKQPEDIFPALRRGSPQPRRFAGNSTMRQPDEITDWLINCISQVYKVPGMYACSRAELDARLWTLHSVWAFLVDREGDFRREAQPMHDPTSPAMGPAGFSDLISDNSELDVVVRHWRTIDERLGLSVPVTPQK